MRLLIVERDSVDIALLRTMLVAENSDVECVSALRLSDALTMLSRQDFDVVLMDLNLPDAQGLAAFRKLHDDYPRVPVVILSGRREDTLALAAMQAGAQDYLMKGFIGGFTLRRALRHAIERQQMVDRLEKSVDELEQNRSAVIRTNQLKNDLIAVLAHDFKGPLTSILGFSELIAEGALDGDDAKDAAKTIGNNAKRLTNLANDTLALSRVEHGELDLVEERVDVVALVREVATMLSDQRQIDVSVGINDPIIIGDAARLRQVFENIIGNAIKYSPGGKPIAVTIRPDGDGIVIAVKDHGIGIPADDIPKLFKRFARASNARMSKIKGTGIGLFLVKMLVETHGGSVNVKSEIGAGTTFEIHLPRNIATARGPRIAVLAEDETQGPFIAYELRTHGYRVREFKSVTEFSEQGSREPFDAFVVERSVVPNAQALRKIVDSPSPYASIGVGGVQTEGWDFCLPLPFLASELHEAVAQATKKYAKKH